MEGFLGDMDDLKRMLEGEFGGGQFTRPNKPAHEQIDELMDYAALYKQKPLFKEGDIITQRNHDRYKVPEPGQPAIVLRVAEPNPQPNSTRETEDTIIAVFVGDTPMVFSVDSIHFELWKEEGGK